MKTLTGSLEMILPVQPIELRVQYRAAFRF